MLGLKSISAVGVILLHKYNDLLPFSGSGNLPIIAVIAARFNGALYHVHSLTPRTVSHNPRGLPVTPTENAAFTLVRCARQPAHTGVAHAVRDSLREARHHGNVLQRRVVGHCAIET